MNKNELHGGARYLGGKVEKAVGDAVGSREWQVDGVVDQVAGGALPSARGSKGSRSQKRAIERWLHAVRMSAIGGKRTFWWTAMEYE